MYAYGLPLNRVAISGSNGPRASLFAPATKEIFGQGVMAAPMRAPRGYSRHLGQGLGPLNNAQDYYVAAQRVIARYDSLVARVAKLANKADRDRIVSDYGLNEPQNKDKSGYMRMALASCIAAAEQFAPIAYEEGFPTHGPCRGRVQKLKSYADDLESEIAASEQTYGILPEPVVIERLIQVPGAAPAGGTNVLPYVVIGGVAVAALAALGVFG